MAKTYSETIADGKRRASQGWNFNQDLDARIVASTYRIAAEMLEGETVYLAL